jgi:hypothetical protein
MSQGTKTSGLFPPHASIKRKPAAIEPRAVQGHSAPSSFVIGATGPPSIADELPSPRQIVANAEGHPRQPAAGAPEKPAAVAGRRGFCDGPKSKVASRPKPAHARDAAGMVAPTHRPDLAAMVKTMMPRRFLAPFLAKSGQIPEAFSRQQSPLTASTVGTMPLPTERIQPEHSERGRRFGTGNWSSRTQKPWRSGGLARSKYPPAEPGALGGEPLKAAIGGATRPQ